jgi:hypothetical protein
MADSAEPLALEAFQAAGRVWLDENVPGMLRGKAGFAMGEGDRATPGPRRT